MNNIYVKKSIKNQVILLNQGIEKGLSFFYTRYFSYFYLRATRATQDPCASKSITQEAFLRLWLFRENVYSDNDIFLFLKTQVKSAIHIFFSKSRNRFHRSLLQLDAVDNYQEFLAGYELEEEEEENLIYLDQLEDEKKEKLDKLNKLIPFLNIEQQLFIKLCLQYSFNYERIAYYLGGISDYEVSLQVEKTINTLRAIFKNADKMDRITRSRKVVLEGKLSPEQSEIFHMRYELQLSFDQIAHELKLNSTTVRKLFIEAHSRIKPSKQIA